MKIEGQLGAAHLSSSALKLTAQVPAKESIEKINSAGQIRSEYLGCIEADFANSKIGGHAITWDRCFVNCGDFEVNPCLKNENLSSPSRE